MTNTTELTPDAEVQYLQQAIQLAIDNVRAGREPFAALVVRDGEVLGAGVNSGVSDSDPTAHAEVAAVREACKRLSTIRLLGATVVSSCEPCAMCHAVCAVAGVSQIIYAAPKELVPDVGGHPRPDLVEMQATLRAMAGDTIRHVPTPGAEEPFAHYVEFIKSRG